MSTESNKHKEAYREEAIELLNELEASLLELEDNRSDMEIIGRVFRALHTIKGSGFMFGFDNIAAFAHDLENVYELVRNGGIEVTKHLIDITLKARDYMLVLLADDQEAYPVDEAEGIRILKDFRDMLPEEVAEAEASVAADREDAAVHEALSGVEKTYRVTFRPSRDIYLKGIDPRMILEDLTDMGRSYVLAYLSEIPPLEVFNHELCYVHWDVLLTTARNINEIRDVFIFVEGDAEVGVSVIDEGGSVFDEADYKRLGEILVEKGSLNSEDIEAIVEGRRLLGQVLVESGMVKPRDVETALAEQKYVQDIRKERADIDHASTVRVPAEKLDRLVDLVGEMVTTQARLTQLTYERNDPFLKGIAEVAQRLTSELHDSAMNIRLVPIGASLGKFRRLVRDLSSSLDRDVNLVMEGGQTELDKTVMDSLTDPIVHILRNCIDHGIEPPEVRAAAGKRRQGTITISALHSGNNVLIRIRDDGSGIDKDSVMAKAVRSGLVSPGQELEERDIFNLIFQPGFSTAKNITNVSGRGVGMDVVKKSVEALRGSVDCESRKGIGTNLTLRIPLTLAIIDGLLVRVADSFYVMPLSMVEECVELIVDESTKRDGRALVNVRDELIPYIKLRDKFAFKDQRPDIEQVVLIRTEDGKRIGVAVDEVIGGHQTVIKSIGRMYRDVRVVSGATVLGDGTVALILDLGKLVEDAEIDEDKATGRIAGR